MCDAFIIYIYVLILFSRSFFFTAALRPVPVTSDQELSVIKSRIAELKAQLNREFKEKRSSTLDKDASFVRWFFFCVQDLHLYNAHVIVMNETNFSLLFAQIL